MTTKLANGLKIFHMARKYTNISIPRPSIIYQNWDLRNENIPSDNPELVCRSLQFGKRVFVLRTSLCNQAHDHCIYYYNTGVVGSRIKVTKVEYFLFKKAHKATCHSGSNSAGFVTRDYRIRPSSVGTTLAEFKITNPAL
jgi:hypothetical protein